MKNLKSIGIYKKRYSSLNGSGFESNKPKNESEYIRKLIRVALKEYLIGPKILFEKLFMVTIYRCGMKYEYYGQPVW